MITMKDVARAAGVSQAAVSYAYTRPEKLSDSQREAIISTAAAMGYPGPHIAGQSLKGQRVGAIGVMVTDTLRYAFTDPSSVSALQGIAEIGDFQEMPVTIVPLHQVERETDVSLYKSRSLPFASPVLRGIVDGLIVHALPDDSRIVAELLKRKFPLVAIDGPLLPGVPAVTIDDRGAAARIAAHVISKGRRDIAILVDRLTPGNPGGRFDEAKIATSTQRVMRDRLLGYRDAILSAGLDFKRVFLVEVGGFSDEESVRAINLVLDAKPNAILAASDVLALQAIDMAQKRGLKIGEGIAIAGFDDIQQASQRGLTTVRQPLVEKGREAARMLKRLLDGKATPSVELPTELIVRAST
jgi:DNA-binding LacI/PurR family transcriptional regulator